LTLVPGASNTYAGAANNEAQNSLLQQSGQRADSEYLNRQGTQFNNQARIRTDNSAVALENLSRRGMAIAGFTTRRRSTGVWK
jgi:hypothetical protein